LLLWKGFHASLNVTSPDVNPVIKLIDVPCHHISLGQNATYLNSNSNSNLKYKSNKYFFKLQNKNVPSAANIPKAFLKMNLTLFGFPNLP
jgi:hypothetical protein